jgi:hypothetical protein
MDKIIKVKIKKGVFKDKIVDIPESHFNRRIHDKNLKERKEVGETKELKKKSKTK